MAYPGPDGRGGGSSIQGQLLEVNIVGCKNLRDKEWFSRQDPYVHIEYATNRFRTHTDTDGGKNPSFNEKFTLPLIEGLREIEATVWNRNTLTYDDLIGTTKILIGNAITKGYDDTAWPLKSRSGKYAGELRVIMHYSNAMKPVQEQGRHSHAPPPPCTCPGPAPGVYAPPYRPQPPPAPGCYPPQPGFAPPGYCAPGVGYPPPPPPAPYPPPLYASAYPGGSPPYPGNVPMYPGSAPMYPWLGGYPSGYMPPAPSYGGPPL